MYSLELQPKAKDDLSKLDKTIGQNILNKLRWLVQNAASLEHTRLSGDLSEYCKLKIGDYRALYIITHETTTISIYKIGHRREIYKL